jgi:hypothetical protein
MSTVVYLIDQPLSPRNYDRFGIQTWFDRGWTVKVWDLTPLTQPRTWHGYTRSGQELKEISNCVLLTAPAQLAQCLAEALDVDYYVDFCGDSYYGAWSKLRLSRGGAVRIVCAVGSIPADGAASSSRLVHKVRKAFASGPHRTLKWLVSACLSRMVARWAPPGLIVVSGGDSVARVVHGPGCETLRAHNLDYDAYLRLKASESERAPFAVFLDQDLCFHPDYVYEDTPVFVTPDRYFPALCRGLRMISGALGVGMRIAAHPRSNYLQTGMNYFEGIPLEQGATAELIRDCQFAVGHFSTVIQLAVLFAKPIIFLTTDELMRSEVGPLAAKFAAELGKTVINVDSDLNAVDWRAELAVDARKYAEYRHRHIKMDGSPELPHWDIVVDHIAKKSGASHPAARTATVVEN